MIKRKVLVECKADEIFFTLLINTLPSSSYEIIHAHGKGNISNKLRNKYINSIAIIDEDPYSTQPKYISEIPIIQEIHPCNIAVKFDKGRGNLIILLKPRLEEWIINTSRISGFSLYQFHLPVTGTELHSIINLQPYSKRYENLIETLIEKKNPCIKTLLQLLTTNK